MRNVSYSWLILVRARDNLRHVHDLDDDELASAVAEVARASKALDAIYRPRRVNVAALGHFIEQLHIHIIGRFETYLV